MQTFLPYPHYRRSAQALDNRRLGNQRNETMIVRRLVRAPANLPWRNHPVVRLWEPYPDELTRYCYAICKEWQRRGFKDTVMFKLWPYIEAIQSLPQKPPWLTADFCLRHQSNLVRKDPAFYSLRFPGVPSDLPYLWS